MPYYVTMTIVTDIHVLEWDYLVLFLDKDWILNLIEEFLVIIVTSKSSVRKEIEKLEKKRNRKIKERWKIEVYYF